VLTLCRRELLSSFLSPLGWILLTLFLLVQGYGFYLFMELISQPQAPHGPVLRYFFGGTVLYWLFVIFIVSVITMRLLAEERRSGTLEPLLTAPVTEGQVVLGKYLAALIFYGVLWLPTLTYVAVVAVLSGPGGISWGAVAAGYLGTMLVGASCLAVGVLASALARSQIISAVLCFTLLSLFLLLSALEHFVSDPTLRAVIVHLDLFEHMEEFARGVVDSRRFAVHLSLIALCLTAAAKALEVGRWR
jgi:ABC-2 type transport system permease protein